MKVAASLVLVNFLCIVPIAEAATPSCQALDRVVAASQTHFVGFYEKRDPSDAADLSGKAKVAFSGADCYASEVGRGSYYCIFRPDLGDSSGDERTMQLDRYKSAFDRWVTECSGATWRSGDDLYLRSYRGSPVRLRTDIDFDEGTFRFDVSIPR